MRAMLFLLLMLAIIFAISMKENAVFPYWQGRLPQITTCLKEGRFRDAVAAAVDATIHEKERLFNRASEPRGEVPTRRVPELQDYAPASEDHAPAIEERAPAIEDTTGRAESVLVIE